jgi:PPP family 3-phenylpropionic acid transporter
LGVLAEVVVFMLIPRLLQRISLKQMLVVSFLLASARWLLLGFFAEQLSILLFAQLLHAATFGSFHAAAILFVQRSFAAHQQGQGQALYAALTGVGGAAGALYAGYSWNALGPHWTFALASLAALAAAVIMLRHRPPEQPAGVTGYGA